ncbi:mitochondrial outer membrane protein porin 2-like [Punica granatum]|uniref:Uncharacterized protein n=2 Tax=Punica granatum TaxID=22663 RepID=A0A218XAY7_PUNGR|nr:mitochondrial outer membrane protein porin 2-like [Punica granatum]OWM82103.1 hypothetical protein CDL15_Pgr001677 [Punica granatum]PKI44895.1 hypothetical protein CRG98_034843 [Punica granatum]
MNTGPGLFSDVGKKARDLLTANYTTDKKFSVNTCSVDNGVVLTSTALKSGGLSTAAVAAKYIYKNSLIDVMVDTESNVLTTVTLTEIFPSTKGIASFKFPDCSSGKMEVQYFHDHATFTTSVALRQSPLINISATVGTPSMAFGAEVGYDTNSGTLTKYSAGVSAQKSDAYASIILGDKGDSIRASYVHHVDKLKKSAAAGEVMRKFSTNENIVTVGGQYTIDPLTVVKGKLNNYGTLGAVLQHEIIPKSLLTISTEVNTKALERTPKFGLSIALVP